MPTPLQPDSFGRPGPTVGRDRARHSRRWALAAIAVSAIGAGRLIPVIAQDDDESTEDEDIEEPILPNTVGELPTTGALRPGPVGAEPPALGPVRAARPTTIVIEQAGIDAEVETLNIVDGVMQNPTGPWVVSWYEETAELGTRGNVVLAGHINYWNVGDAVFANLAELQSGTEVVLSGEDGRPYRYAVEWVETFEVAELTSGTLQEVVSPTPESVVTLITCGGEFDYASGEYLSRTVARALLVE
jgi:Sortase domain